MGECGSCCAPSGCLLGEGASRRVRLWVAFWRPASVGLTWGGGEPGVGPGDMEKLS